MLKKENSISVVTTVKNGRRYILETLDSVYKQTFRDFEHIIVDDGSTDGTVELIRAFQKSHPEYVVKLFEPGCLGRGKALNFAVSKARFKWIAIVDADDIWHPMKLEIQMEILNRHSDASVLATASDVFSDVNNLRFKEGGFLGTADIIKSSALLLKNPLSHSSVIIAKEDAIYDILRTSQFDLELWYRLSITENKKLMKCNEILTFHRIHPNQSFESKGAAYRWNAYRLKLHYSLKSKKIYPIIYGLFQFIVGSLIARVRLILKTKRS